MRRTAVLFLPLLLLVACSGDTMETETAPTAEPSAPPSGTRQAPYMGHGIIQQIDEGRLVINHETIPGFMAAMTMPFKVTDEVDMESLAVGDEITFSIERLSSGDYHIFRVEPVED